MTIKIINFQVVEMHTTRPVAKKLWQWLLGIQELDQYHFDVRIKYSDLPMKLVFKERDVVQLPNGVKLLIYSVDRENNLKAKTMMMTVEDLRGYHPIEMYLVYPRIHGLITDRNAPRL